MALLRSFFVFRRALLFRAGEPFGQSLRSYVENRHEGDGHQRRSNHASEYNRADRPLAGSAGSGGKEKRRNYKLLDSACLSIFFNQGLNVNTVKPVFWG